MKLRPGGIGRRDLAALVWLALPLAILFGLPWLAGETYFWGDLTYIHHPWRTLIAELVTRGALPLWNPYAYMGMPLAAEMQCAAWYPGSLLFYFFPFECALPLHQAAHFFLAGAFTYLWLKRLGFGRPACWGGAVLYMLGGTMAARIPFLNHAATLAFFPAFLLLAWSLVPLALASALAFLSGYPPMLAGQALASFAAAAALRPRDIPRLAARWASAGALAAGLAACLLLPAIELAADSRRTGGLDAAETLTWSYSARDLLQFVAPALARDFSPAVNWWKTSYLGFGACAAALAGLAVLPRRAAAALLVYLAAVVVLVLGGNTATSRWLWTHLSPLSYIRYPGNAAYLAAPALAALAAAGLHRLSSLRRGSRLAWLAAFAVAAELLAYAVGSQPTAPRGFFPDAGPLVDRLRAEVDGHRYLISPRAMHWQRGRGSNPKSAFMDFKHRLYGLSNMPYHLSATVSFGEPLVPRRTFDFLNFLQSLPGAGAAAAWMPWADAAVLLARERQDAPGLEYVGETLWHLHRGRAPAGRAFYLQEAEGGRLPAGLENPPATAAAVALPVARPREDRFEVIGSFPRPGWIFVSEPLVAGWRSEGGASQPEPALRAFQKLRVPGGPWRVRFRYDPASWRLGLALTTLFLGAFSAYWYNRVRLLAR